MLCACMYAYVHTYLLKYNRTNIYIAIYIYIYIQIIINVQQVPVANGVYEVRYYPSAMESNATCKYHDIYWMKAKFTVINS